MLHMSPRVKGWGRYLPVEKSLAPETEPVLPFFVHEVVSNLLIRLRLAASI